jgi:hypothetical protein
VRGALVLAALAPLASHAQPAPLKGAPGTPPEDRRAYTVDGIEVRLPPPDGLTDQEVTEFLLAIKRGRVVWRAATLVSPRVIRLSEIDFVGASGPPRLYHVFLQPPERVPRAYAMPRERPIVLDAEFDGGLVTIVRASVLYR